MSRFNDSHISINADGVPVITGTGTKVVELVLDHLAHCSDAQEIHREYPHLSLGAIYTRCHTTTTIRLRSTRISRGGCGKSMLSNPISMRRKGLREFG